MINDLTMNLKKLFKLHLDEKTESLFQIMEKEKVDGLFIESGFPEYYFLDDQTSPFRPNPHFLFFCPDQGQGHLLKIKPGKKPKLFYFSPNEFWEEPSKLKNEFWEEFFDIEVVYESSKIWKKARETNGKNVIISPQPEKGLKNYCILPPNDFLSKIHWLRVSKTEYELTCLKEATRKAAFGHRGAKEAFFQGASEFEILQIYLKASKQRESELPYGNIIALNEKAAFLHYQKTRFIKNAMSFLIDAGARHLGYCSDITRTHFVEKVPSLFKDLHRGLETLQQSLCQQVVPQLDFPEIQDAAFRGISQLLIDLGIFHCSMEQAMDLKLSKAFFPHGIGHSLGLQVHDVAGHHNNQGKLLSSPKEYPKLRTLRKIQTNDVLTIEPGIYFIPPLLEKIKHDKKSNHFINWTLVEKLKPLGGIRIEDNVVAKVTGPFNLTREFLPH